MASKAQPRQKNQNAQSDKESNSEVTSDNNRVLMPREYYDVKHPWFGSQIHYTIDVFRQLFRDTRARKQHSSKDGS